MNARITATHFVTPATAQSAAELAPILNCEESWIHQNVGVSNRFVCQQGDDPAELAALAAKQVIQRTGAPDLLIYASASIRQCIPDTSVFVARELGLTECSTFSINATCLSFLVALQNATALIKAGIHRRVLIASAEQPTLSRNFRHAESAALFGDGAAAAMVEASEDAVGILQYRQTTWPEHSELAQIRGGGLLRHPENETTRATDYLFEMDGESLLRTALPKLKTFLHDFFENSDVKLDDVDLIVPHQASAAGMKLLHRLGFAPEKTVNILADYGNCVSASIPMALAIAERDGRIQRGDNILLLGTAAGFSIGAAILKW